jgi:hypothetical protein
LFAAAIAGRCSRSTVARGTRLEDFADDAIENCVVRHLIAPTSTMLQARKNAP